MKIKILIISCIFNLCATENWQLGIENIGTKLDSFKHRSIALVANQCSLTQDERTSLELLQQKGFTITALLAPEHGFSGKIAAAKDVHDDIDESTRIPIVSLYQHGTHKTPPNLLTNIDALFFDLPHCGMRHYTYISTLYKLLELAALQNIPIVVFDRPSPLGPLMDGPLVDKNLISFISIAPIPLRYGLSMGELARYFNNKILPKPAHLLVIPMHNYQRTQKNQPFQKPLSPNIPTLKSCYGYSFLGLLEEIAPFFAGNGTNKPFQYILLPEKITLTPHQWNHISTILTQYHINSKPAQLYRKKNQTWYTGLELTFLDIKTTQSFSLLLQLLRTFKRFGVLFTLSPSFDKAIGTIMVRQYLDGTISYEQLAQSINKSLVQFYQHVRPYFLYTTHPSLTLLKIQPTASSTIYAKRYDRSHAAKKSSIA